jgi:hypothetical protein
MVLIPVMVAPVSISGNRGDFILWHRRVRERGVFLSEEPSLTENKLLNVIMLTMKTLIEVSICTQKEDQILSYALKVRAEMPRTMAMAIMNMLRLRRIPMPTFWRVLRCVRRRRQIGIDMTEFLCQAGAMVERNHLLRASVIISEMTV